MPFVEAAKELGAWEEADDDATSRAKPAASPRLEVFDFAAARQAADLAARRLAVAQAEAAMRASVLWAGARAPAILELDGDQVGDHPYLKRKRCRPHGTRVDCAGRLLVPMHVGDELVSLQTISADGTKLFLSGGRAKGAVFVLNDDALDDAVVWVAEGFATAATVHEATGAPTVAAFSAGNLEAGVAAARRLYPHAEVAIAADHDAAGLQAARAAARLIGGGLCYPATPGRDWNDERVADGWAPVIAELQACERQALSRRCGRAR